MSDDATLDLLARMLRQRGELGAPPFFMEGLDRAQALALLARAAAGGAARHGGGGRVSRGSRGCAASSLRPAPWGRWNRPANRGRP